LIALVLTTKKQVIKPPHTPETQKRNRKQVLQQEAYPATRPLSTPKTRPSLGLSSPK